MLSTKIKGRSIGKMRSMRLLAIILLTAVAVFFTMGESALAKGFKKKSEELDEAKVFIEWNSSDEDHGIQFFWDSLGFTRMMVINESGKKVLDVSTKNSVRDQGLTEVAIESVEPDESDQTRRQFFRRFPEGDYRFWGKSTEGGWLHGEAEFTHALLEPLRIRAALPDIVWRQNEVDDTTGDVLEVVGYEIVIELVVSVEEDGEEEERVYKETTTLSADFNEYVVSETFMDLIDSFDSGETLELKIEILADEPSGNRTITELVLIEQED